MVYAYVWMVRFFYMICVTRVNKNRSPDFNNLRVRLGQNGVQEKLTRLWIDRSLRQLGLRQTAAE